MRPRASWLGVLLIGSYGAAKAAPAGTQTAGLERFRAIYKELVETNTTLSAGDCTLAARAGAGLA